jgi:hypothetical protein
MISRRAPKGKTFDPCPGCGSVDEYSPRAKDDVCSSCRNILNAHAKTVKEAQDNDLVSVGIPEMAHDFPYIIHDEGDLKAKFHAVAMAVSTPGSSEVPALDEHRRLVLRPVGSGGGCNNWYPYHEKDFRIMSKQAALALRDLYEGILKSVPASYEEGKSEGRNLLAMLNAGELTNADFDRRAGITPKN